MKKFFIITGIVFAILFVAIVTVPFLFKDDIQKALDQTLDESLNATVFYDTDKFGLSLIKNFPDFTLSVGDFGIAGVDEFIGDTLVSVGNFQITIDLMSVITGDQIMIEEILLENPKIEILVMENGKANYDIAKEGAPTEDEEETEETAESDSDIRIGIKNWTISNGTVIYLDQSMHFYTTLLGLNHSGTGDFTLDVFDLQTETEISDVSLTFEGEEYISSKRFFADVTLNMDLSNMTFTFKENRIAVNDFAMGADGFISMPGEDIVMDITFGGKDIDLKSILSLIPGAYQEYLDGVSASGEIGFDGYVKGTYNESSMPQIAANLSVDKGKILYADYPVPIEDLTIKSSFNYPSADLRETSFNVDNFHMLLDGEELSAYLKFKNLEDYQWDFGVDGNADLEKIAKIVPMEGMSLVGKFNAKLNSAGKMSDVEAEQYEKLATSGSLTIQGFEFSSQDLPESFGISSASLSFDPSQIKLSEFVAQAGNTDMNLSGEIKNYLGFALGKDEMLLGNLNFKSNLIDLNEWMTEEEATEEQPENEPEAEEENLDSVALEVIKIPTNIDFVLASNISKISYTNLSIENFNGKVLIKDGAIILDDNNFQLLDGAFNLSGSYQTKDLDEPKYDFNFGIKELSIASAYQSFETIQKYVPIAKQVSGKFSTDFSVAGILGQDMMPIMDEMNLNGLVNVAQAALESGDFVEKVSALTSLKGVSSANSTKKQVSIKDVLIATEIKNGRLFVEPFDLDVNGQKATLGGSNSLEGSL
ncbi:MAG: AsmA-like C-terminal region-containing protein, partial [Bacteroidota bacterium]